MSEQTKQIKVLVDGKTRILRNIRELTKTRLWATYKGFNINSEFEDDDFGGGWFVCISAPNGCYIAQAMFREGKTIEDMVKYCIENILYD